MADDLEARLSSHARAFEGLMSLIPAKDYYTQDNNNENQKAKQSKVEKEAARRARLHPQSNKSAQEVLNDIDRKRKRELASVEDDDDDESTDADRPGKERPREGLKPSSKKQKKEDVDEEPTTTHSSEAVISKREAKRKAKAEKKDKRGEHPQRQKDEDKQSGGRVTQEAAVKVPKRVNKISQTASIDDSGELNQLELDGLRDVEGETGSTATPTPQPASPASTIPSTSSSSSIVPPETADATEAEGEQPAVNSSVQPRRTRPLLVNNEAREKLRARIEALRAARGANGMKSRQDLLEARRQQQERKMRKKETRKLAKDKEEEEQRRATEAELALLRGSGSPLTGSDMFSPRVETENNFTFGRVALEDGRQLDADKASFRDFGKKKGPSDVRTALQAAEKKKARLAGLDKAKRAEIEEKELILNATKRAHGEKVRDDPSLLKKTLKRKEKIKGKSEKEWTERITGVQEGIRKRQQKREENLRKRKEEKGSKGKKAKKPAKKPKGRPGFEGGFKSKK